MQPAVRNLQGEFAGFLTAAVPSQVLDRAGRAVVEQGLTISSLARFVADIGRDERPHTFAFPGETGHYDLFNFLFVNFNYTTLLDSFVYLDQAQFDPHPFSQADRNFQFYPNPDSSPAFRGNSNTSWSSYVLTETVHPHGNVGVPRSLLFGVDSDGEASSWDAQRTWMIAKPFWAQNRVKYSHLFDDTRLFVIFGSSLGASDGWWWRSIGQALADTRAELVIYWFVPAGEKLDQQALRNRFLDAANVGERRSEVEAKIFIVPFGEEDPPVWLNMAVRG